MNIIYLKTINWTVDYSIQSYVKQLTIIEQVSQIMR